LEIAGWWTFGISISSVQTAGRPSTNFRSSRRLTDLCTVETATESDVRLDGPVVVAAAEEAAGRAAPAVGATGGTR